MKVETQTINGKKHGEIRSFGGSALFASYDEVRIIKKGLELYLDYNPRKAKDKPDYEEKKLAVEMIEAIRHPEYVSVGKE